VKAPGGVVARRAIVRWAVRLLRREWRQQALVIALLLAAVTVSALAVAVAANGARSPTAEYGTATKRIQLETDTATFAREVEAARSYFGTIEVIRRSRQPVLGTTTRYEVRGQDPHGPFAASTLALLTGRYPEGDGEVALTDGVAKLTNLRLGGLLHFADRNRTVVGIVENPFDLDNEFALVPPSSDLPGETLTILFRASDQRAHEFPSPRPVFVDSRPNDTPGINALGVFTISALTLVFVALAAAAGFVVVAQRRLRQLGMLAAVGATRRHLRLVMLANGVVVGAIAGIAGTVLALAAWFAVRSRLEPLVAHRIDPWNLPWALLLTEALLAVAVATAASWWPARSVARHPVMEALTGRPAPIKSRHRSVLLALGLLALGVVCFGFGIHPEQDQEINPLLFFPGVAVVALAVPLLCPAAVSLLGRIPGSTPVAARLALRDLARYQARSAAALATITLGLALSVAIVAVAAAARRPPDEGNLSNHQLLVRIGDVDLTNDYAYVPERTPRELARLDATIGQIAASLDHPTVVALDTAVDPSKDLVRNLQVLHSAALLFRALGPRGQDGVDYVSQLYLVTPQTLAYLGLNPGAVSAGAQLLTPHTGPFVVASKAGAVDVTTVDTIHTTAFTRAPTSLITPRFARTHGLTRVRAGWLLDSRTLITGSQLSAAQSIAADAGITVEARDPQTGLARLRVAAASAGVLLALSVLALTVGLIRSEAANDLRILTATGATSATRRTITAATTSALALTAALLGAAIAYISLIAGYWPAAGRLTQIPYTELAILIAGIPLAAGAAAWLLAGREPTDLNRTAIP
jgi:putative ABC transport system permease protein